MKNRTHVVKYTSSFIALSKKCAKATGHGVKIALNYVETIRFCRNAILIKNQWLAIAKCIIFAKTHAEAGYSYALHSISTD